MEQDIFKEPLLKERGYVKSISAGLRLPLRHPIGFLRHLWPLLILNTLVWAAVSKPLGSALWDFYLAAFGDGVMVGDLVCPALYALIGWGALAMIMLGLWSGEVSYLMRRYAELDYLPAVKPWHVWRDILPLLAKGVVACLLGYAVVAGIVVLSLTLMPGRLWALVMFLVLSLVWTIVYVPFCQQYMMSGRPIATSLMWPLKHPGCMGGSSAVLVVCGLLVVSVIAVACIPSVCATYVGGLSDLTVAMGDTTDLPGSFCWLRAISFGLTFLVAPIAWTFLMVPLSFHWGSDESSRLP